MFSTRRSRIALTLAVAAALGSWTLALAWQWRKHQPTDPSLEQLTEVKPSTVPGAGLGAFARSRIPRGTRVAVLGGELSTEAADVDDTYRIRLPPCAFRRTWPYDALDASQGGGPGARINFAPSKLNDVATGLQNVEIVAACEPPFITFVTTRDVSAGEELFTTYGRRYDYDFMAYPDVRAHFCKVVGVDCSVRYAWEP